MLKMGWLSAIHSARFQAVYRQRAGMLVYIGKIFRSQILNGFGAGNGAVIDRNRQAEAAAACPLLRALRT